MAANEMSSGQPLGPDLADLDAVETQRWSREMSRGVNARSLRSMVPVVALMLVAASCGGSSSHFRGRARSTDTEGPPGCVALLRMPKQSRPLVDILFDLPQQPLVATPTGNNDDISFYNGSSPLMKIEGTSVSNSQVQTAPRAPRRLGL